METIEYEYLVIEFAVSTRSPMPALSGDPTRRVVHVESMKPEGNGMYRCVALTEKKLKKYV